MAKIETYILATQPLSFSDMLIGTEVGGPIPNATKNFSLAELYNLFASLPAVGNLQQTLNAGNTATQNIFLTGNITSTNIKPTYIIDGLNTTGAVGEVLIRSFSGISWGPSVPATIQQVLNAGNTATQNIILTGNITSTQVIPGNIKDGLGNLGTIGQILSKTSTGIQWINNVAGVQDLQSVLNIGNTATANIILTGNITSTNLSGTNTGDQTTITGNAGTATVLQTARIIGTLTGDASSAGSSFNGAADNTNALTLATVNTNVGSFTNSTITVNAKGLVTAASSGASAVTTVTATTPLSSSGGSTPNLTIQQSSGSQNGYLSGTDWTTFNNKQPAGNYITSLTGEATGTGPGATSVILSNAAVIGKLLTGLSITGSTISSSDNILTAFGKVQNQINGLIGGVQFQGVWNAATNTPALVSSVGTQGYYYIVDVAGNTNLNGISDWQVGDWAIFNGSTWNKVDNTDLVTSVNGQTGAVSLTTDNIPEGATNLYYLDSRARAALSFAAGSGAYNSTTGVITIPTNNSQILNGAGYITLVSLSATSPLSYNNLTGAFSIQVANTTQDGYLSSTDWNTFNGKQNYLNGTGLVKSVAGVISYITDNSANWNTAYNDSIVSAAVTGTATKTLTLNQQDGGTITASWSDIDTGLTSVGVSMPSAFSVANSPLITNGTIAITGAGVASQYIRGDGTLANFPTSGGGGASVSYYLNGSVSQGTIGGVAYKEMNSVPVIGAGTDFTINANGYIAQFITDVGDPNKLLIPAGNWNFEMFFSASSGGGSPSFYVELYKYDGTIFTLIASDSATPEGITNGTTIDLYTTALAVPQTTLTLTDRLAIRVYVTHSGRTITLHTENSHLCQVITTFSSGLTALNGLTSQVQYLAVGTTGTDFGISSATDTHTFNLPTASASNRGALSSADWTTFNSKEPAITAGTTLQYYRGDKTFQTLNTTVVPEGTNLYYLDSRARTAISLTTTGSSGASTYNNTTGVFNIPDYGSALSGYVPTSRQLSINGTQYDLSADRSWSVGTVTTVSFTLGGTGTDLNSSVVNSTTTPAITLNVPTASAANRGALSAADWSTFNTKVGGVTATSPLFSSGGSTPNITIQQSSGSQAGYLSSTDWTTFNNKQAAGNYITSLTGEATATGPGAAAVTLDNAAVTGKILTGVNITGGTILSTDSILTGFGKLQNQVNGLIGGSIYQGTWNASTNTPTLTSSVGTAGYYYIVSVAGTTNLNGITDWQVGDWAIFNGGVWQKVDNTDSVISVNGQTGAVSLTTDNISEGVTNLYFTNTRARAALSFVAGSGAYNSSTGAITIPTNTSQLTNGANFITLASLSGTAPISYNSGTGAISITQSGTASNGYLSSTDWNTFNNKQSTITLTTTGTSGAATFTSNTLNIPQYQGVLTNPVTGTGTTNYLPKWTSGSAIGNSVIYESTGGNIGIGETNPTSYPLQVKGADGQGIQYEDTNGVRTLLGSYLSKAIIGTLTNHAVGFWANNSEKMILSTSGNLGLGVTPSAWYVSEGYRALQVGNASLFGRNSTNSELYLSSNTYENSSGNPTYITSDFATRYFQNDGLHTWLTAPSGTAGNAITFTQAMTLTASGNLGIGTTSPASKLGVAGDITLQLSGAAIRDINNNALLSVQSSNELWLGGGGVGFSTIFYANAAEKMRLASSGNVLIGTTTDAGYKLDVNGTGRFSNTTEIRVNTNDYGNNLLLANSYPNNDIATSISFGHNTQSGDPDIMARISGYVDDRTSGNRKGSLRFYTASGGTLTQQLSIASTGAATFSGKVNMNLSANVPTSQEIQFGTASGDYIGQYYGSDSKLHFYNGTGGADFLNISRSTGAATFSSSVTAVSGFLQSANTNSVVDIFTLSNPSQTSSGVRQKFANGYGDLAAIKVSQIDNGAGADNGKIEFQTATDAVLSTKLTILDTGAATFSSSVTATTLIVNTSGQSRTISTFYGAGSDGNNIFIGGGGLSSGTGGGASYLGSYNIANGVNALFSNTTGYYNTANGVDALFSNTTGYQNTANGVSALVSNTTGVNNTANGVNALYSNTTGHQNTANGYQAGYGTGTNANTTGTNNIFIGNESVGVSATESNRTWIGNSSTTSTWLGGNVLVGTTTNAGYKLDVNGTGRFSGVLSVFVGGNDTRLANFSTSTYGSARGLRINSYQSSNGGQDCAIEFDAGVATYGGFKFSNSGTPMLTLVATGAATFSSGVTATSFSNAGLQSGEVFNATKSNAGYYVGYFQNTSATGLGLYIQNGNDSNDAIRIGNAAGSANNIQLYGSGKAYFAGNVGIGTSSPAANLEVYNATQGNIYISSSGTNASVLRFFSGGNEYATIRSLGNGNLAFETGTGSPAERMRITSGGNVLVGTTTSTAGVFTLQVGNGTADTRAYFNPSNAFAIAVSNSGGNAYYLGVGASGSAGSFQIYSNATGSANLTIASTGAATFSSSVTATQGNFNQTATSGFAINMTNRNNNQTWSLIVDTDAVDDKILGFQSSYGFTPFYALKLDAATGAATFSSSLKTAAPSGGTAKPFRIGAAAAVTPTSQNRTIEIEIDGTTYYLTAKTTND